MWSCSLFLLAAVAVAVCNAHTCIHDKLQQLAAVRRAAAPAHFEHASDSSSGSGDGARKRRIDYAVTVPSEHTPLRVHLDFSFLDVANDPFGLCVKVDQWARLGSPPAGSEATHTPVCSPKCDSVDAMLQSGSTCNCWFKCAEADIFYRQKRDVLVNRLFPAAVARLQQSFSVLRTPIDVSFNNWPANPTVGLPCTQYRTCHECTDPAITGAAQKCSWCKGVGNNQPNRCVASDTCAAPLTLTASGDACESCGCSGEVVPMTKALIQKYSNYTEHDMVLFVTAHTTRLFSGSTLAYACACRSNMLGRPTFGHINWGSNTIDFGTENRIDMQVGVAVHEMTHALMFASGNFKAFLDTSKADQYLGKTIPPNFVYPKRAESDVSGTETVVTTGLGGKEVRKIVNFVKSPKALERARAHFGCPTLKYVELEDGGSSGTAGSHWEKRLFNNEYMTGSSAYDPVYSDITMALFEDSGWYTVNYTNAQPFFWGRGEGCDFVRPRCDKWPGAYQCTPAERGFWGCSFDYKSRGVCSATQYSDALPLWNQYFVGNASVGGSELPDFCPFYTYSANLQSFCTEPTYQTDNLATRGEHFSDASRCLDSTLLADNKKGLRGSGACYALRCIRGKLFARINNKFRDCSVPGSEIKIAGFNGRVKCPSALLAAEFCSQVPSANGLPVVTSVTPKTGRRPLPGDRFDVEGTDLADVTVVRIGSSLCSKLIGAPTATRVQCEVEATPSPMPTPAPTPAQSQDVFNAISDLFVVDNSANVLDIVVETPDGLAGVLDNGFLVNTAAVAVVSCFTPLVATGLLCLGL
jgi:hypothetical protein